jgi:mercuric ion binding protein
MKTFFQALTCAGIVAATPALAAERTVTFAVENMSCASCPYIVKASMAAVPGVSKVIVSFAAKTATVTFDDARATPDSIATASMNAGYPAHARQQGS